MALKLVLGRTGSGKTDYILNTIKNLLKDDPFCRVIVIVPEQATFRMERDVIEACNLEGLFNLSVVSFDRLVHELIMTYGGRTYTPLDFIGKTMLTRTVLDKHREQLTVFVKSASQPGFEIKMTEMISELKRQSVSLADLKKAQDLTLPDLTKQKLADIALLYTAYQDKLSNAHLDSEDILSLATEKAEENLFFNGAHVLVDGFDLLTNQMLTLLSVALKQAVSTLITFKKSTHACNDAKVFEPEEKLYYRITETAKSLGIKFEEVYLTPKNIADTKYNADALYHLEQNLFAYPFTPYPFTPKSITLTALDSRAAEVKDTCANIINLVNDGFRFKDICLCVSDINSYKNTLTQTLTENNIPFFMDAKTKLMDTAFAEFLISLLDFILYKDTTDFIVHVKSGFLDMDMQSLNAVENHIKHYQLKGYMLNYKFKSVEPKTEKARKVLTNPIFELMRSLKSAKTAEAYRQDILTYLRTLNIDDNIEAFSKALEEEVDMDGALVFAQVFSKIVDIINQACVLFKGTPISFSSFVSAIKAGLEAVEIAIIPPSTDDVLVGDFSRTVFPATKALFILGLNDGKIPTSPDVSSVLTDTEKIVLEKQGIRAGYRDRFFEERLKIYTVFTKPTHQLYLSYANSTDKQNANPSVLVGRVQHIFPKLQLNTFTPRQTVYTQLSKQSLFKDMVLSLNQSLDGLPISDTWRDVHAYFAQDKKWQADIVALNKRLNATDKKETLTAQTAKALYTPLSASVSRVERFYNCPHLYFIDYGIKPQKDDIFEETPLDIGNFLHACMHNFNQALTQQNTRWADMTDKDVTTLAETIAASERLLHNKGLLNQKKYNFIFERLKLDFVSAAKVVKDQLYDTDVNVYASELSLQNEQYLTFVLADGTPINLTCKIDRVDVLETNEVKAVRIIDYKASGKKASLKDLYYGLSIQLLIYLKFIVAYFKAKGENVAIGGAFYFDLSLPLEKNNTRDHLLKAKRMSGYLVDNADLNARFSKLDGSALVATQGSVTKSGSINKQTSTVFSSDAFDVLFNHCENLMKSAMTQILNGEVTPLPYKDGTITPCSYCDYKSICLFDADIDPYRNIDKKERTDFNIEG